MRSYKDILARIEHNNQRIVDGKLNSIPLPFDRFNKSFKGTAPAKYYAVTATTHGGKTKFTKFLNVINSYRVFKRYGKDFRLLWFALEESEEEFETSLISCILYAKSQGRMIISSSDITAIAELTPAGALEILRHNEDVARTYEEIRSKIVLYDNVYSGPEMYNITRAYMSGMGTFETTTDKLMNETETYTRNPLYDEIDVKVVVDHISLIHPISGKSHHETLSHVSSYYFNYLMKKVLKVSIMVVHQQELGAAKKVYQRGELIVELLEPSIPNLGDNKIISRDYDVVFGLFNPAAFELTHYRGRDITEYCGNAHWLIVLKDRLYGTTGTYVGLEFFGAPGMYKELPPLVE